MTERHVQSLVIGAGPAGYVAALRLAQLGRQVLVVDKSRVGGTCLNWGCIPTKALLHAAHTIHLAREAEMMGVKFAAPEIDLTCLGRWRAKIVDRLVRGIEYLFRQSNVEFIQATAGFVDADCIQLVGSDGRVQLVRPEATIVATGSEPVAIPGLEPDGVRIISSSEALLLERIPPRLLIVGAGAIGLEFATLYVRLGSSVTVVELLDQVVPGADRELAGILERSLRRQGVRILLSSRVEKVSGRCSEGPLLAKVTSGAERHSEGEVLEVDQVLIAVGRRPLTRGLGLEHAGVELDAQGFVAVDESLRTNSPGIFAIGDVARPPLLAHKASREGIVVAEVVAGRKAQLELETVPSCVFTDPELASVGLTQARAEERGFDVQVGRMPLTALGRAATLNRSDGMCKVVADARTGRILGVHILAPEASSLIGEGAVAIANGLTTHQIAKAVHPHPTMSELLMEAAEAAYGQAIHVVNPGRC